MFRRLRAGLLAALALLPLVAQAQTANTPPQGSVLYRSAAGWKVLTPGPQGYALCSNGAATDPAWCSPNNNASAITSGSLALPGSGTFAGGFGFQPSLSYSALSYGMRQMEAGLTYGWWDAAGKHILITNGGTTASLNGLYDSTQAFPSMWQHAIMFNAMFARWQIAKATGRSAEPIRAMLAQDWAWLKALYPASFLQGDGSSQTIGGVNYPATVNLSDDAGWLAMLLAEAHEATGDGDALYDLGEMIPATARRFADPQQTTANGLRNSYGTSPGGSPLSNGKYGMLYAAATDSAGISAYGYVSTAYETWLANAAFYYYSQTQNGIYRQFAADTYNWIKQRLTTPAPADATKDAQYLIYGELVLNQGAAPTNPQPKNAYFGKPVRGIDNTALYGTFGESVLGARLYGDGGNSSPAPQG